MHSKIQFGRDLVSFSPHLKVPPFYVPLVAGKAGEVVPESFFVLRVSGNG
jgi:hypothetical protein